MKNKQITATVIRPFCFTGPRRGARFSIASDAVQIVKMMQGKQEKVLQIGNLDTTRAVTDVRDIANAFTQAGQELSKSEVRLPEGPLRHTGEFEVTVQLHAEVKAKILSDCQLAGQYYKTSKVEDDEVYQHMCTNQFKISNLFLHISIDLIEYSIPV